MKFVQAIVAGFATCCWLLTANGASASEKPRRVLFFDPIYSTKFVAEPKESARYFQKRGFETMTAKELAAWMEQATADGSAAGTVVLNFTGITPRVLAEPFDKDALLYRYCAAGGRWIAAGGNVLTLFQSETDVRIYQQWESENIPNRMIGAFCIKPVYGLTGANIQLTEEGKKWGLVEGAWTGQFLRGGAMPPEQVTHVLAQSADGTATPVWHVNVNPEYPLSGLIGFAAVQVSPDNEPVLEQMYRLAMYDGGAAVEAPKVDWRTPKVPPTVVVDLSMKPASVERRAYQRGETIPLRLSISGPEYTGQNAIVSLRQGESMMWSKEYPGASPALEISESIDTAAMRSQEYVLDVRLAGRERSVREEILWICSPRANNEYLLAIGKGLDDNMLREEITSKWIREHNLNVNYYNGHHLKSGLEQFARYVDQMMRFNLIGNANLSCIPLLAELDRPEDALVLPDSRKILEGEKAMMASRALVNNYADIIRNGHREQAQILHDMRNPVLRPVLVTNDDSTYTGHFDFSERTAKDFEEKTGMPWSSVPKPVQVGQSHHFRGEHAEGIVDDNDPWLTYMRYQIGKYEKILELTMQGTQSGWPGALVGEIPCMSGPMFIERSIYPPIHGKGINMVSFYMYHWLPQYYTFSVECSRMNNRGEPGMYTISSSWMNWGRIYQRVITYHTLAENPAGVMLYRLDHPPAPHLQAREAEQYDELSKIGAKMSRVARLLEGANVPRRKAALFIGFAQTCFNPDDRDQQFAAFANLLRAGADVELVSEEEIQDGKATDYEVIVLNGIRWMQKSTQRAMEAYLHSGGKVLADAGTTISLEGMTKLSDLIAKEQMDYAEARSVALCRQLVGKHIPVSPRMVGGDANTIIRPLAKGDQWLAWVLDVETSEQARELSDARSGARWESGQYEVYTAWNEKTPVVKKEICVADGLFAYDLWTNREIELSPAKNGWRTGSLDVELLGASLVAIYPQRIGAFAAGQTNIQSQLGQSISASFELRGKDGRPFKGQVPVEVRAYYPDGTEAWEYGRDTVMTDGKLNVSLALARNDPQGTWRICVRELCTNLQAETTVSVAAP